MIAGQPSIWYAPSLCFVMLDLRRFKDFKVTDPVYSSLMLAAEKAGDITPAIYNRYFSQCPGSQQLMSHIDELVQGKMMEEVFRLIMVEQYEQESAYLNFEVKNHKYAYSVLPHMYENLLEAVHYTVRAALRKDWSEEFERAWQARISALIGEIEQRQDAAY